MRRLKVTVVEVVCDQEVGDFDDGADHVVVGAIAFDQPGPATTAEMVVR